MERLLIVEDEPAHAELIRRAFESHDEVEAKLTFVDSLAGVQSEDQESMPDLIICDYVLPDGHGTSLLPGRDKAVMCPVVLMTSHGDEGIAVEAMKAGALDYLVKSPDAFDSLPILVERWLRERRLISRRQLAEENLRAKEVELEHLSRLSTLGEMVAGIAHEINQPLQAITSYAAACEGILENEDEYSKPDGLRQWLASIRQQAMDCGDIIHRLRDFARSREHTRSDCDLNEIVRESIGLLNSEANRLGIRIDLRADSPAPHFVGGRVQIQQVVVNLLRNAYQSMEGCEAERRLAIVRTMAHSDTVQFSVQDYGHGLSTDSDRILEPFYTTKADGMGMGLAISRSIIEVHSGKLRYESAGGRGATFEFEIRKR